MGAPKAQEATTPEKVNLADTAQFVNYGEIKDQLRGFSKTFGGMSAGEETQIKAMAERNLNAYGNKAVADATNTAAASGLSPNAVLKAQSDFSAKAIDKMGELDYNINKDNRETVNAGRQSWLQKMLELSQGVSANNTGRFGQNVAVSNAYNANEEMRYRNDKANDIDWGAIAGMIGGSSLQLATAFSRREYKKNIKFVRNVKGINFYNFEYKDKKHGTGLQYGVMIDEIEKILPEAVIGDKVNYNVVNSYIGG